MNCELVRDLTGDLAATTAWNALTHVTTSRRANVIFVSRDAHANTGYSHVAHRETFVAMREKKCHLQSKQSASHGTFLTRILTVHFMFSAVITLRIFTELWQQSVQLATGIAHLSRKKTDNKCYNNNFQFLAVKC